MYNRSVRAITQSPYSRYKASQSLQGADYSINVVEDVKIVWNNGKEYVTGLYDIASAITRQPMHLQLSNSFDQWRISTVTIKCQVKSFSGDILDFFEDTPYTEYIMFFTALNRSAKQTANSLEEIASNSTYQEVTWPASGIGFCPPLIRKIVGSSLRFSSTKMTYPFSYLTYGIRRDLKSVWLKEGNFSTPFTISFQISAKCTYRGLRLDKSNVYTAINPNLITNLTSSEWYAPELASFIYTRGIYGEDPDEQIELMNQHWTFQEIEGNVAVGSGRGIIVIIPYMYQANVYTFTGCINKRTTSANYLIPMGTYYLVVPNIFHDYTTATACLYFYSTNHKLIALQQLQNNGLTVLTRIFTLHVNIQQLLTK